MDVTIEQEWETVPGLLAAYGPFRAAFEELVHKDPNVARFIISDLKGLADRPKQQSSAHIVLLPKKQGQPEETPANTNTVKATLSPGQFALFVLALVEANPDIRMNLIFEAFEKANLDVGNQVACFRRIKRLGMSGPGGDKKPYFTWQTGHLPPVRLAPAGQGFFMRLLCGDEPKFLTESELNAFLKVLEPVACGITQRSADVRTLMKGREATGK